MKKQKPNQTVYETTIKVEEPKKPFFDSAWLYPVSVSICVGFYFGVTNLVDYIKNHPKCPHEVAIRKEQEEAIKEQKRKLDELNNTFNVEVTNGTAQVTNWGTRATISTNGIWSAYPYTNISTVPYIIALKVCKDCGKIVDREDRKENAWGTVWFNNK